MRLVIPIRTRPIAECKRTFPMGKRIMHVDTSDRKAYKATVTQYVIAKLNDLGHRDLPLSGPIALQIAFCFGRPDSYPKKPTERKPWPYDHTVKPDLDNCEKIIADVLTACGVWQDDAQVCEKTSHKFYADQEGTIIVVEQMEGCDRIVSFEEVLEALV